MGRDRIAQLEAHYRAALRHMWIAILVLYLAAGGSFALLKVAFDKQQQSRVENIADRCASDNKRNRAIQHFIGERAPRLRAKAIRDFPTIRNCRAYARSQAALPK